MELHNSFLIAFIFMLLCLLYERINVTKFSSCLELYISSAENVLNHKLFLLIVRDHIAEFR